MWLRSFVGLLALGVTACLLPDLSEFERCADGCGAGAPTAGHGGGGDSPVGGAGGLGSGGDATGGEGAASGAGGGSGGAAGSGGTAPCDLGPGRHGSPGVENPQVPGRCIDEMETSWQDYALFLTEAADFAVSDALSAVCGWKGASAIDFRPVESIYSEFIADTSLAMRPVQGIDWCDAATYCEWAGKELCGSGNPDVPVDRQDSFWRDLTEWARACTANDDTPNEEGCYVAGAPSDPMDRTLDVDTPCVGSLGLHHTLNNVWEWESNCMEAGEVADPADDDCRYRGTPYADGGQIPECNWANSDATSRRDHKAYHVGFRCCWSSQP